MPAKKTQSKLTPPIGIDHLRYVPAQRFTRVEYVEEGETDDSQPFWARIRSNLTFGELEDLTWDQGTPTVEIWDKIAPYVVEWNAAALDDSGTVVDLEPPAVAGGEQFRLIPNNMFWKLLVDLKTRALGVVEKKRSTPAATTDGAGSNDASTSGASDSPT